MSGWERVEQKGRRNLMCEAYLDIETTGLLHSYDDITVIGIYLVGGNDERLV